MYKAPDELTALLERSPFLELQSSRDLYPNAKGEGLPLLRLQTPLCRAVISLQGAHLLEWQANGGAPLLWLSPNCNFTPGTALRGGVPICLPWFGPNRQDPKKPKHGFARNRDWRLHSADLRPDGHCELVFEFSSQANELFDYSFAARLRMVLAESATLELTVTNTDTRDFPCSWALHSYHPVSSLDEVQVVGLAGRHYLDNLSNYAVKHQTGEVSFSGEVDRVFPGVENELYIRGTPTIAITHGHCPSVIVWNPGAANAANIADIGAGQEQHYICVERGAVLDEEWTLAAGESKTGWLRFAEH